MRVLFVTSEIATLYKRGGLADVSYALPVALSQLGVNVSVAMPYYEKVTTKGMTCVGQLAIDYDRRRELVFVFRTILPHSHVRAYLLRHPLLNDYDDLHIANRFAFFSKAVAQLSLYSEDILGGPYDIIHCNDWHTALIPLLIGEQSKVGYRERETIQSRHVKTILTVHNLLYQGEAGFSITLKLGFPKTIFHPFMTPLGKAVRLLTEGFEYADVVTTVSPTYAKEIARGVHGKRVVEVFKRRKDRMIGILNGLDTKLWDPNTDPALPVHYRPSSVGPAKAMIKTLLQQAVRLPKSDVPLFGFVGRLERRQKGLDLVARAITKLLAEDYQLVLLGTGQKKLVELFKTLAEKHHNIAFVHTFDERLARRIYAGSDIMLVPSKFEPCGLTQMIAMRYGTLPLVRKTGGLADTVTDGKTGFVFGPYTSTALVKKMQEAIHLYRENPKHFAAMRGASMRVDFSWEHQVKEYIGLYKKLLNSTAF
ncbi:MAG: glycogen synthase [Patescibacteria group bacterium]